MKLKKFVACALVVQLSAIFAHGVAQANEYDQIGVNVLDSIGANEAYNQGYTGAGVTVGVTDVPANLDHSEFSSKRHSAAIGAYPNTANYWEKFKHGTHVAGIVAAQKDGRGMHGVAYGADVVANSVGLNYTADGSGWRSTNPYAFDSYLRDPNIKVINNSWGSTHNFLSSEIPTSEADIQSVYDSITYAYPKFQDLARQKKLMVFAAGNDAELTPGAELYYGLAHRADAGSFLGVSAVDASGLTKSGSTLKASPKALATFTNFGVFYEDHMIAAPGVNIVAPNASDPNGYIAMSGTSMAAPVVTGATALVQQAFPYLNGQQLGQVLLTTANKDIVNEKGYYITIKPNDDRRSVTMQIFYTNDAYGQEAQKRDVKEIIREYYELNKDNLARTYGVRSADVLVSQPTQTYENTPIETLFGQGYVNVGKAVKGLGAINVRYLTKRDVTDRYTYLGQKTKQGLLTINTAGYNSTWSNDIGQIRAGIIGEKPIDQFDEKKDRDLVDLRDRYHFYQSLVQKNPDTKLVIDKQVADYNAWVRDNGLVGIDAGLIKTGAGTLTLAGHNTYKGATVVRGGTLKVNGSIAGDGYTEGKGVLGGTGVIMGNVYNNGAIAAGDFDNEVNTRALAAAVAASTPLDRVNSKARASVEAAANEHQVLTINGSLSGSGKIYVNSTLNGQLTEIKVKKNADLTKMHVEAGTHLLPNATGMFITSDGDLKLMEDKTFKLSGFIDGVVLKGEGNSLTISTALNNNSNASGDTYDALMGLYNEQSQRKGDLSELAQLFALNSKAASSAVASLQKAYYLNAAQLAMRNQDVDQAVQAIDHAQHQGRAWVNLGASTGKTQDLKNNRYGIAVGYALFKSDSVTAGLLGSFSQNSLNEDALSGNYNHYNVGGYVVANVGASSLSGFVNYGLYQGDIDSNIGELASRTTANAKGTVLGAGAKYAYNIGLTDTITVAPYVKANFAYLNQNALSTSGSQAFNLNVDQVSGNYFASTLGVNVAKKVNHSTVGADLGVKRVFTGTDLSSSATFTQAKQGTSFTVQSVSEDPTQFVFGAYVSSALTDNLHVSLEAGGSVAKDTNQLGASLNATYSFY